LRFLIILVTPQGNKITIDYERTIKTKKHYQEIIGQYLDIKERGIIKQVIYYTDYGFADKLKQLFAVVGFIYRRGKTDKCTLEQLRYFRFL
ncbi:MAG: hypothetical protein K2Q03_10985, partial [Sphingobacteriaceae bacterium]|nr:hypothetical protein [Sphingobacteriaceae bacterium]